MNRATVLSRVLTIGFALLVALASSSCDSASGMGVGAGAPARWTGPTGSPPVFAGGPAYR